MKNLDDKLEKLEKIEVKEETKELISFNMPQPASFMQAKPIQENLSLLKMPYAIEGDFKKPYHMVFLDTPHTYLEEPYFICSFASRDATRILLECGKYERGYSSTLLTDGSILETDCSKVYERHIEELQNGNTNIIRGISYVVFVYYQNKWRSAIFETFKVMKDYWSYVMNNANYHKGVYAKINTIDHSENLVDSKTNKNHKYLNPKLFTGYELLKIPADLNLSLIEAIKNSKLGIEGWFKQ